MDQNQFSNPAVGEAKQVPPPPQTPEVKLRTMDSDVSSIAKTGGSSPTPEFVAPPAGGSIFRPETKNQTSPSFSMPDTPEVKTDMSGGAKAVVWIVIVLICLGIAAGIYYYVWPMFSGAPSEPAVTTEAPGQPQPVPTPTPTGSVTHVSHFDFPNEIIPKVSVSDYSIVAFLTALQNEANNAGVPGDLREIAVVDASGQSVTFSKFMATLMPEIISSKLEEGLRQVFEDDFTAYLYFDDNGVWPGYSVKTKANTNVDIVTLQSQLAGIEAASFSNLFLTPPGNAQAFRTGTVKDVYTNRFAPLSQTGASFNYGLFDGRLLVNTSYGGLLKALELMGL